MKITTNKLLKAIRAKCLDCCCDQPLEVRLCLSKDCGIYPYRMGAEHSRPKKQSDEKNPIQNDE